MPVEDINITHEASLAEEALPVGTVLSGDQFTITGRLGAGGFGITYRATDNVLGRTIVIKECFPEGLCYRDGQDVVARKSAQEAQIRSIVKMFMREARSLAKLRHPNIVGVHRVFEENGTAYMVIDLIEGRDLFDILDKNPKTLSPGRVFDILVQLLDAIEKVHEMGLLHRDISPDNIIIENSGTPVLIDFGAARADSSHHTRAVSAFLVVKDGYSPQEFYVAGSEQLPCSDLYALAATFYHVLSGEAPVNSQTRMMEMAGNKPDPCAPLEGRISGYDDEFLRAIDQAMQIHPGDRLQTAAKWKAMIQEARPASSAIPRTDLRPSTNAIPLDLELSLTRLVEETNDEVRRSRQIPVEPKAEETPPQKREDKPAWVEEFNRDSLTRSAEETNIISEDLDWHLPTEDVEFEEKEEEAEEWIDQRRSHIVSKPSHTGTNWVDRALQKQERIRSEREQALAAAEAERINSEGGERSASAEPFPEDLEELEEVADRGTPRANRLVGILFGLLIGLSTVFFLQWP